MVRKYRHRFCIQPKRHSDLKSYTNYDNTKSQRVLCSLTLPEELHENDSGNQTTEEALT
jgi:hypothetical protein